MAGKVTWKIAIKKVLKDSKQPIHYSTITKIIIKNKYKKTNGLTPVKTVYRSLKRMIKKNDKEVIEIEKGYFSVKKNQ